MYDERVNLEQMVLYLKEYDSIFEKKYDEDTCIGVICYTLTMLKQMPEKIFRIKGSYELRKYDEEASELFYIIDMANLKQLLKNKMYAKFIHELCDFLEYKILKQDLILNNCLPVNIKNALILVIEQGMEE